MIEHPLQAQVAGAQHLLVDFGVPVLDEAEGEVDIVLVVYAEAMALLWQGFPFLKEVEVLPQRVVVNHLFPKQENDDFSLLELQIINFRQQGFLLKYIYLS